jgi:predicted nucleic acid-binding protein
MPELYLLDTSAVMTLLEDEPGADRVEEILRNEQVLLTWVTLLEVYYHALRKRGQPFAEQRYTALKQLTDFLVHEVDEPTLLIAGTLKANFRMSLADAMIAAHAIQHEATLVHKDPELAALQGQVRLESLPFKKN